MSIESTLSNNENSVVDTIKMDQDFGQMKKLNKDLLLLKKLEARYDNVMDEYNRTYETYIYYVKGNTLIENTYPVNIQNPDALINNKFTGDITKDECFASCANDTTCQYVLWSETGTEQNIGCAPNRCKKYTDAGGGLSPAQDGVVEDNPICIGKLEAIETSSSEASENVEDYPSSTTYKYHGWEKPKWEIKEDTSIATLNADENKADWIDLNTQNDVDACNAAAQLHAHGPFGSVVFNTINKSCYGGILGTPKEFISNTGFTTSIPPTGHTGQLGESQSYLVNKLKELNGELQHLLDQISNLSKNINSTEIDNEELSKYALDRIFKKVNRLRADRIRIDSLSDKLATLDGQQESIKLQHKTSQTLYLGMGIIFVGLAFITYKQIAKKTQNI